MFQTSVNTLKYYLELNVIITYNETTTTIIIIMKTLMTITTSRMILIFCRLFAQNVLYLKDNWSALLEPYFFSELVKGQCHRGDKCQICFHLTYNGPFIWETSYLTAWLVCLSRDPIIAGLRGQRSRSQKSRMSNLLLNQKKNMIVWANISTFVFST